VKGKGGGSERLASRDDKQAKMSYKLILITCNMF